MKNIPGHTHEYAGKMPIRQDVEIEPESKESIRKREREYWIWRLCNLWPPTRIKNNAAIKQWEKELAEYVEEGRKAQKAAWARGEATTLLPLEMGFPKPHPVPPRGKLGWKVTEMEMVTVGFDNAEE